MINKSDVLRDFNETFDLDRIAHLPVPDKFKLADLITHIYREALVAGQHGVLSLEKSPHYTADPTYNLFAMLVINGMRYDHIKTIMINYARHFKFSDVYYASLVINGMGVLMIERGFLPSSIKNYLMHLLGNEFLTENLKYSGSPDPDDQTALELKTEIKYKPFDGNYRKVKYDLLALIRLHHEEGIEKVRRVIQNSYGNKKLAFYFNMLDTKDVIIQEELYRKLQQNMGEMDRLLIAGAYAIVTGTNVFAAHYLFNSILGKYSRYDKRTEEIEDELAMRLGEILEKHRS